MAFVTGKSADVIVNGITVHDILKNVAVSTTVDAHDSTTFKYDEHQFVPGLKNATLTGEGLIEDSGTITAQLISLFQTNNGVWTVYPKIAAFGSSGDQGFGFLAAETAIDVSSPVDDLATMSVSAQSNIGAQLLRLLYFNVATVTANGPTVDNAAASSAGGAGYLQVISINAGTAAVTLRHSTDNFSASDVLLASFTTASGVGGERITFAGTVNRYVRAVITLAGGANSVALNIGLNRG